MILSLKQTKGAHLMSVDDTFGSCKDFYFHDRTREVIYIVADTSRWLLGRQVLLSPQSVESASGRHLRLNLRREQIQNSPALDEHQPVSRQREESLYTHYGWTPYWKESATEDTAQTTPPIGPEANDTAMETEQEDRGDPHLISFNEILGYRALSFGDNVGNIADLLIDDDSWRIEYLVIDTKPWVHGGRRVIPAPFIQSVESYGHCINITMPPVEVEQCADFDLLDLPLDNEERASLDELNKLARHQ